MKAACSFCDNEASIVGLVSLDIQACVKCYGKLIDKNAHWTPETTRDELDEMVRKRKPLELTVSSSETPSPLTVDS